MNFVKYEGTWGKVGENEGTSERLKKFLGSLGSWGNGEEFRKFLGMFGKVGGISGKLGEQRGN